jgi:hypothetical protein
VVVDIKEFMTWWTAIGMTSNPNHQEVPYTYEMVTSLSLDFFGKDHYEFFEWLIEVEIASTPHPHGLEPQLLEQEEDTKLLT